MKYLIIAAILTGSTSNVMAADDSHYVELGECIAYSAVVAGLDGKKPVDPQTAAKVSALANEYMFEASVLGLDDNTAQTNIVNKLIEMNTMAQEKGSQAVSALHSAKCDALTASMMKG